VVKSNEDISSKQGDQHHDRLHFGQQYFNQPVNHPLDEEALPSDQLPPLHSRKTVLGQFPSSIPQQFLYRLQQYITAGGTSAWQGFVKLMQYRLTGIFYLRVLFWSSLLIAGAGAYAVYEGWQRLEQGLPDVDTVLTYKRDGTITITASDGSILQQVGPATHEELEIWDYPDTLVKAFIASEDRRFYEHDGVDYQGVMRAIVTNVMARDVLEGGSTITQQLARTVFLTQERSVGRKLREALLAQKIEQDISKDQIVERYLNLVYLGSGAYGVADAAWVYFKKSVDQLTLPEMALIAGLAPAPSDYSPIVNPDIALERRNTVLDLMEQEGFITTAEAEAAKDAPLGLNPALPKRLLVNYPYFTTYIQQELPRYISSEAIEAGGLTVETTVDIKWQALGERIVREAIQVHGLGQGFTQAALVSIDPRTGEIKALVGGADFKTSQFNRASQAQRQPGSTFKTFVYSTAIEAGFSPYDSYLDAPYKIDGYEPLNANRKNAGWISMKDALTHSVNVVAVKVLVELGFDTVIEVARRMGIESTLRPTYSLALGSSETNLLEITGAYGTLAAEGRHIKVHGIKRIIDRNGKVLFDAKSLKPVQAVDKGTAAILTWMLQSVVTSGTGSPAQLFDRPVAGKTGTSENARDLWFIGYIPQLVTGIWLGNDDNSPTWGASTTAAFTWRQFMREATKGMQVEEFPKLPELGSWKGRIKPKPLRNVRTAPGTSSSASPSGWNDPNKRPSPAVPSASPGVGTSPSPSQFPESPTGSSTSPGSPLGAPDLPPPVEDPIAPAAPVAPPPPATEPFPTPAPIPDANAFPSPTETQSP
jgi:penicillin-binding protein 1A